jgi:hypothetical protein
LIQSGLSCITLTNDDGTETAADDGDGLGCEAAGVGSDGSISGLTVNVNGDDGSVICSGFCSYPDLTTTITTIGAPSNGPSTNTKHLACAADVAINYAVGFIPFANTAKFAIAATGFNTNLVQHFALGTSLVSAGPTAFNSLAALGSAYQGITLPAFKNAGGVALSNLPKAGLITDLGVIAKQAGTIGNLLNTVSARIRPLPVLSKTMKNLIRLYAFWYGCLGTLCAFAWYIAAMLGTQQSRMMYG